MEWTCVHVITGTIQDCNIVPLIHSLWCILKLAMRLLSFLHQSSITVFSCEEFRGGWAINLALFIFYVFILNLFRSPWHWCSQNVINARRRKTAGGDRKKTWKPSRVWSVNTLRRHLPGSWRAVWPTRAAMRYCCTCLSLGIIGSSIEMQWQQNRTKATETAYKAPVAHWCISRRHLCNQALAPTNPPFELLIVQYGPCTWFPNQHSGNADKALKPADPGFSIVYTYNPKRFPFVPSWLYL